MLHLKIDANTFRKLSGRQYRHISNVARKYQRKVFSRHSGRTKHPKQSRSNIWTVCWKKVQTPARGQTFFSHLFGKPDFDACNQCTYGFLALLPESNALADKDDYSLRQMTQLGPIALIVLTTYANIIWTWYFRADTIDMRENIQIFMTAQERFCHTKNGKFLACSAITWSTC